MSDAIYPSIDELVETNRRVLGEIRVKKADQHKILSKKALEIALAKARSEKGDIYDKAAVLLIELVRGHAFASGVRRTAYSATISFLKTNGENPAVPHGYKARILYETGSQELAERKCDQAVQTRMNPSF